ncbi:MAG: hypothetical protein WCG87_05920 [Bacteroidota bacterium]
MIVLFPELPGLSIDNDDWKNWALYIREHGLCNAYGSTSDYLPFYQYVLWIYGKIASDLDGILRNYSFLRGFSFMFDLAGIWYVYLWMEKKMDLILVLFISLFNIAYTYDTFVWGQLDGMLSAMLFISLFYAFRQNTLWSAVWYLMALNLKLQAIVFLPLWGLLIINTIITTRDWKKAVLPLAVMAILQAIILIPFTTGQYGLNNVWARVIGSIDMFPVLNIGAPNFWNWVKDGYLRTTPDNVIWFSAFTYKQVGLFLFFFTSFLVLLPICIHVFRRLTNTFKHSQISKEIVWLTGALLYLVFFYFNTQMHERYSQPAFICIAAYAFYSKDYFPYILFSIVYFLNLEFCVQNMHLHNYDIAIFSPRFLAALYTIIILYLGFKLYYIAFFVRSQKMSDTPKK